MNVLFVDDEAQVLRGLERMIDAADMDWDAEFAGSGPEALQMLDEDTFDAIVTDMRMPGMDGAELLAEVTRAHPTIIRIVFSGQADKSTVLRAVEPMHQYLAKPCDATTLKSTISRAVAMRETLQSESLRETISNLPGLPSLPTVYQELTEAIQSEDFALSDVGGIIEQDIAITAKILQLVNSAAFGLGQPVASLPLAASLLGLETIKALVLTTGVFQKFDGDASRGFSLEALMSHSLAVANGARRISRAEGMSIECINEVFTAGMLHDIGKLVLATSDADAFAEVGNLASGKNIPTWKAEQQVYGADHSAVGAYLLSLWGLPQSIVELVALHHRPEVEHDEAASTLTSVWAANLICNDARDCELEEQLARIQCTARLAVWRESCMPPPEEEL